MKTRSMHSNDGFNVLLGKRAHPRATTFMGAEDITPMGGALFKTVDVPSLRNRAVREAIDGASIPYLQRPLHPGYPVIGTHGTHVGAILFTPGQVMDNMNQLDVQMESLEHDFKLNVDKPDVVALWTKFHDNWTTFHNDHKSVLSILAMGTGDAWRQTERYRDQLRQWLVTYVKNAPKDKPPTSAEVPEAPKVGPNANDKKSGSSWYELDASTIVLLTLGAVGVLGLLVFAAVQAPRVLTGVAAVKSGG